MTVVLSIAGHDLIIMAADSAVMLDFGDTREYELGRKAYMFSGIGCVTTWGSRDGNQIGLYLGKKLDSSKGLDVSDLANLTYEYLTDVYRPSDLSFDDVGYHVSGFDSKGIPKLFHVFWGFDRPRPAEQTQRAYKIYDHSPPDNGFYFLYNGRNDLAYSVINTFLNEIASGGDTNFDLSNQTDRLCLADLTLRFSSEMTPQVSPPFIYHLINNKNQSSRIRNDELIPINRDYVLDSINQLQA